MKRMRLILAWGFSMLVFNFTFAQEKLDIKYGKILPADFDLSKKAFDTSVHAVILADIGYTTFEANNKDWFSLIYKRHTRIKILNRNALDEANIQIPLFFDGADEEKLENLKAASYNLEDGKVVEAKLDASSIFKEKVNRNLVIKKFTIPAVKEGSIIDYTYTVKSDFLFNLQPWTFQREYPCLWSEYQTSIPEFFVYVFLSQGYLPYHINKQDQSFQSFNIMLSNGAQRSDRVTLNGNMKINRWVIKNVPALKEESFTSTIKNHVAKIEFQLSQYRFPNLPPRDIMGNWVTVAEKLKASESFGATLDRNNNWLDDEMKSITAGSVNSIDKAHKIFNFVRDNFTCTDDHSRDIDDSKSLKSVFKARNGSVAEINLLLTAMFKHEAIEAYPVILSTRERGLTNELYPLMNKFNYVICDANIDGQNYYLDASVPMLGFGKLESRCYNGHARVIKNLPEPIYFEPDSLKENKLTAIFLMNGDKDKLVGSSTSTLGYFESISVREKIKSKGMDEMFKKIKSSYAFDINIIDKNIDSLKKYDDPVLVRYSFSTNKPTEDILYINPMMTEGYKENPFKSADRFYPVEMPSTFDETYIFTMEVPENYVVDEIPKSAKINFNEGEGYFEYLISKSDSQVQLRSRIYLKRAIFDAEEYQTLRDFFSYIVKKHGEQIVFKKKKP